MSKEHIILAWKSETYRNSLSAEQLKNLPDNPAGFMELSSEELGTAAGGEATTEMMLTYGCCPYTGMISFAFGCTQWKLFCGAKLE